MLATDTSTSAELEKSRENLAPKFDPADFWKSQSQKRPDDDRLIFWTVFFAHPLYLNTSGFEIKIPELSLDENFSS